MTLPGVLLELAAGPAAGAALNLDFALLDPCPKGSADAVVVCGSRGARSPYRLPILPKTYERRPLRAEANLGGTRATARVTSTTRPDGLQDNRVMITFGTRF